jgi:hypothetical protein
MFHQNLLNRANGGRERFGEAFDLLLGLEFP